METWIIGIIIAALAVVAIGVFIAGLLVTSGRCSDEEDRFEEEWRKSHSACNKEEEKHGNFVS